MGVFEDGLKNSDCPRLSDDFVPIMRTLGNKIHTL